MTPLHKVINRKNGEGKFILSPLLYTDDYLGPYIGERTVRFHYWKHLGGYIDKVNSLLGKNTHQTIEDIIRERDYFTPLYRNASQVYNHYLYFEQLNSKGAKQPLCMMQNLIKGHFGSFEVLKNSLLEAGLSIFGSGWVFLLTDSAMKNLHIEPYMGTFTPVSEVPLLALDVWEHAYYLDYQNDRKLYLEQFFEAIDWSVVEERLPI